MEKEYLKRFIDNELITWAESKDRKPLLLRGARQVGKTTSIRQLAKAFDYYIEINFEERKDIHNFFNNNLSPEEIVENISLYFNTPVIEEKTLIFFDEIQSCIPALSSLRFFYEKKPNLHIIAAGSLLEFALHAVPSFGVGRIRSMFIFPLSFDEFLLSLGEEKLITYKKENRQNKSLNAAIHEKLIRYLRKFFIIGGMPEVIKNYINGNNIIECQRIMDDLLVSYFDDFGKYEERVPATRISEIFNSVAHQLGGKFVLSKASPQSNHNQIKEALDLLIKAGLVIPVTHTSANGLPLGAEVRLNRRKMLLLDTGLAHRLAGLDIKDILSSDATELINKGSIAELFVGLEILKASSPYERKDLYFWQREALNSNAEVDYLLQKGTAIIPIEVKSGTKGSMQSLNLFLKEKNINKGVRISLENYAKYNNIEVIPMYAVRGLVNG